MGFLSKFFKGTKPQQIAPVQTDTRSPAEKALSEAQAGYFNQRMGMPGLGYEDTSREMDPVYEREFQDYSRRVSGAAADRGFGSLRHGPSVSTIGRGAQAMGENRAAGEAAKRDEYRRWIMSAGRTAATPMGRNYMQPQMTQGSPSAFGQLLAPAVSAFGTAFGGPLGGAAASGFANMFNKPPSSSGSSSWAPYGNAEYYA
jgi:hypothetical protein